MHAPSARVLQRTVLTPMFGRDIERGFVLDALDRGRLVSLVGPGGVGKTRLAADVLERSTDEVKAFVALAALTEGDLVSAAVAEACGVGSMTASDPTSAVAALARDRPCLLVLDNCEHVATAVAEFIIDLLTRTGSSCRVIATSRRSLGVPGERSIPLGPLTLPTSDDPDRVASASATRLFIDVVARHDPSFAVNADNATTIRAIARRVDGLPLALELAASRVRALALDDLLERLDDQMSFLRTDGAIADVRHAELAAVIAWSADRLAESSQSLLMQLSVFAGSFSLSAAEAVCVLEGAPLESALAELVYASLVTRDDTSTSTRYRMLEPIRQFGGRRLRAGPLDGADEPQTGRTFVFRETIGGWTIGPRGQAVRVRDEVGLRHVHRLLSSTGEVPALVLSGGLDLGETEVEVIDEEAARAYRRRLLHLDEELEEARLTADAAREAAADAERDALIQELGRATGMAGRPRLAPAGRERARVSVTKAIRRALVRLEAHAPVVAHHLGATIRTGTICSYERGVEADVQWEL